MAVWIRLRAELRTRWRAWLGLALLVGLASGVVMTLAAGARRTDTAYDRFLDDHRAYDVMVLNFPGFGTVFDFDELARLPQVADSARAAHETISLAGNHLVDLDGRVGTEINRHKLLEGRLADPDEPAEVVVSFVLAEQLGLEVGDTIEPFSPQLVAFGEAVDPELGRAVAQVGAQFRAAVPDGLLRIVGITAAPGELPPRFQDDRPLIHHTQAFDRLFEPRFSEQAGTALLVRLHGGTGAVDEFLAELQSRAEGAPIDVVVQRDHARLVNRSIHFQAQALWLLAGLTAFIACLIVGQLVVRFTRIESAENSILASIGMTRRELSVLGALRAAGIGAVGAITGALAATLASGAFPTGLARIAEPTPGLRADPAVLAVGAALTMATVAAAGGWSVLRATRPLRTTPAQDATEPSPRVLSQVLVGAPVAAYVGIRMALDAGRGRSALPVRSTLGIVSLGVLAVTAALTFGGSLSHLLASPRLYGVTWDLELSTFATASVRPEQLEEPGGDARLVGLAVGRISDAAETGRIEVEGRRVDAIVLEAVKGDITPPALEGRAPAAPDEIVLGARTFRSLDREVGDHVSVRSLGSGEPVEMKVVGVAALPIASAYAHLGEGAWVTPEGAAVLRPQGPSVAFELADGPTSVMLAFAPEADQDQVTADVAADLEDRLGFELRRLPPPKPNDILDLGRVESLPLALGGILAAISAATLTHLLLSTVRGRRHDLAVLRALGFGRRQVGATVLWQAATVTLIGLGVGIPLGVAIGRRLWTAVADNLGVVAEPVTSIPVIVLLMASAAAITSLIALLPARLASRTQPAAALRSD